MNDNALRFDPHQFAKDPGAFVAGRHEGGNYDHYDASRTQTFTRDITHRGWTPPFALDTEKLKRVLLFRTWQYAHPGTLFPEQIDRSEINRLATAKELKYGATIGDNASTIQHEMAAAHRAAVKRAGGYMEFITAIAFRAWRLGNTSVQVAESLGIKPECVRVQLTRAREAAAFLGYDIGKRHHSYRDGRRHYTGRCTAGRDAFHSVLKV